ncbi:MAG: hypothetical protein C4290_12540, partial [Chloroflexota bacterium]
VNTTLFLLLAVEAASGVGSFLTGAPDGRWVVALHGAGGWALALLLLWKARVVRHALRRKGFGRRVLPSLALLMLLVVTLASGLAWSWAAPGPMLGYPVLTWHVGAALLMVPLLAPHVRVGWPQPGVRDVVGRRLFLYRGTLALAGATLWAGGEGLLRLARLPGGRRRFTGSQPVASPHGNDFPVTSWLFDHPAPVDTASWRLWVTGAVARPLGLSLGELVPTHDQEAVLDCTGGWYAHRRWQGVPLGALLARAGPLPGARSVVVHSVTGYARRFSLREAERALLATHVDGDPLSHGHGAPLRLIVPDRRGYEWVKWVEGVEVSRRSPLWRWPLPPR